MSRAANCYDNAFMESCFGTIQPELEMIEYQNSREARQDIASYLTYYNHDRRHAYLTYLSPAAFQDQLTRSNEATRLSEISQAAQRVLPPDREHLAPAFARLFLRVGLPDDATPFA